LRVVGFLIIGVSAYLFVRHIDGHALARALGHARPSLLAVAGLLALGQLACRAGVFRTLLFPVVSLPWLRVQRFMLAAAATTAVVPGRAGEFMRAYLLKRDDNVAVAATAAVTAVEKGLEVLSLSLVLAPVPFLLQHLPAWVDRAILCAAGIAAGLLSMTAILATRTRPPRWLASFSAGLEIVRRPSLFGKALLMELGSWLPFYRFGIFTLWFHGYLQASLVGTSAILPSPNRICKMSDNEDYVSHIHLRRQTIPNLSPLAIVIGSPARPPSYNG
jgi:hypothetical protein